MITVNRLHKILGALIEKGHGRKPVCVHKDSFYHPLEDEGTTILEISAVEMDWIPNGDDDGGTAENKDGTESGRWTCVIGGGQADFTRTLREESGDRARQKAEEHRALSREVQRLTLIGQAAKRYVDANNAVIAYQKPESGFGHAKPLRPGLPCIIEMHAATKALYAFFPQSEAPNVDIPQ